MEKGDRQLTQGENLRRAGCPPWDTNLGIGKGKRARIGSERNVIGTDLRALLENQER